MQAQGYGGGYATAGDGGTFGGTIYGNTAILPLMGGSGGGGGSRTSTTMTSGGGGGGAILIGAQTSIAINGSVDARGGNCGGDYGDGGGGSGGAIRLITPSISGTGFLNASRGTAYPNNGGVGRIRIDAAAQNLGSLTITPTASVADPGNTPMFWPDTATPAVRVVSLNGVAVPTTPQGMLTYPWQDVYLSGTGDVTALLEATNVQTTSTMQVFITKQGGTRTLLSSGSVTLVGGSEALSTWRAVFTSVPNGMFAIQARAVLP
jgi:hypothetical protein